MHIAAIVVSYNTKELLRDCLNSIVISFESEATDADKLSVVVVDSASSDGSPEMVSAEFPQATLLAQTDNIGFVAGNNLALQSLGFAITPSTTDDRSPITDHGPSPTDDRSPPTAHRLPDAVLLLNPDAQLVDSALWEMACFFGQNSQAGACGAHLEYGDGSFQHGAFRFPSLAQVVIDFFPLTGLPGVYRIHNSKLNGRYSQVLWRGQSPFEVDFVLGAALMVRGDVIAQIGGLDPEYVMYCEEMDWCLRVGEAGYGVYAVPTAKVIHHEGQSSKQRRWETYVLLWRSRFRFYQKHRALYPAGYTWALRPILAFGLWWRKRQARSRFANGDLSGIEVAAELSAYETVGNL